MRRSVWVGGLAAVSTAVSLASPASLQTGRSFEAIALAPAPTPALTPEAAITTAPAVAPVETPVPVQPVPSAVPPTPEPAPSAVPTPASPATTDHKKQSVYILADSLGVGSSEAYLGENDLSARIRAKGWDRVFVKAACGRPVTGGETFNSCDSGFTGPAQIVNDKDQIKKSQVAVIALATNDYQQDPGVFRKAAEGMIDNIESYNPDARILWADIYLAGHGESYKRINEVIHSLGVEVIKVAATQKQYYKSDCSSDGIHLCKAGSASRADLLAGAIGPAPNK